MRSWRSGSTCCSAGRGQFAFAHIAFFAIGIYATALLQMHLGIPFILGVPLAAALANTVGLLIAIPATRLRTVYLALATYAFAECAQWVLRTWDSLTKGADGLRFSPSDIFGYVVDTGPACLSADGACPRARAAGVSSISPARGSAARSAAIRDSEHVAATCGIDVKRTKVIAFVLSAVLAGIARRHLHAPTVLRGRPTRSGLAQLVLVLTMVVVGSSTARSAACWSAWC